MIISASRRTDIPAFYSAWFMNRIRAGFCTVRKGFGETRISLAPADVDVIVFWTRNPKPLLPHLDELDRRGFRCYFQYTLTGAPKSLEPKSPPLDHAIAAFQELADRIGPDRVIWRYDPIVVTSETLPGWHVANHEKIAIALDGCTHRCVVSLVDFYKKAAARLQALPNVTVYTPSLTQTPDSIARMTRLMLRTSMAHGMELQACSENSLAQHGATPGKCIDDQLIKEVWGIDVSHDKDGSQRRECGCVRSIDIGAYDTCPFACTYCYATNSPDLAKTQHRQHDPNAVSL